MSWKGLDPLILNEAGVKAEGGRVEIPYRRMDGELHAVRIFEGVKTWWDRAGVGVIPYGLDRLPADLTGKAVVLCEGESDCLAFRQHVAEVHGYPFTAYLPVGFPGASTWRQEWATVLTGASAIYVAGDGDRAGRMFNDAVLTTVPGARWIRIPEGEDVRSILQAHGGTRLMELIVEADWRARLAATLPIAASADEWARLSWG